ncbi:MAG: GNAT family N-acetyltransferase [Alphaproteobacteria bacterium]|nr:GNAT family N-acetyltransferase [Alphaproteobacteria bacterium]
MKIRKFIPEDLPQVLEICREVRDYHIEILNGYFKPQDDNSEKIPFLKSLEDEKYIALVAEENGAVIGYLSAEKREAPYLVESRLAHIANFGVKKAFQSRGVGRKLMDTFYGICQQAGIDEIRLGVFNKNKQAYRFYQKYGFEEFEQRMHVKVKKITPKL